MSHIDQDLNCRIAYSPKNRREKLGLTDCDLELVVELLAKSQECSLVSLRDVQRVLVVLEWFMGKFVPLISIRFLKNL